jgi:hypothetical protein
VRTLPAILLGAFAVLFLATTSARADDADPRLEDARKAFAEGTELVRVAKYGEALSRFEASAAKRPHAITVYNIGFCERALARYTRSRAQLRAALARNQANPGELPDNLAAEAKVNLDEIERVLAHLEVTLDPPDATLVVDGRPLAPEPGDATPPRVVAGVLPPDPMGKPPPARVFQIDLDPGAHVIVASHPGFDDTLVNDTYAPGARRTLTLKMSEQQATMHVRSNETGAIVTLDKKDLGAAPVDIRRPAGNYQLAVTKDGFVPWEEEVRVRSGQELQLVAPLQKQSHSVFKTWWFWTAAGVIVAGAVATTYALTRPGTTSERPPPNGGALGWAPQVQ